MDHAVSSLGEARLLTPLSPTPAREPAVKLSVRFLFMVGCLSLFGPLCIDMYLPALPQISTDLHAGASAVQLSLTTCLVGVAIGQMVIGPVSDRLGRRKPLFFGLALFIAVSLACTVAPSVAVLAALRFCQGFGGAAGIVIARAIVRDLHDGVAAARFFSVLMLVVGAGPVFAPQIGAEILRITSWRGVFVVLAIIGSLIFAFAALRLPETLPLERRGKSGIAATLRSMQNVISNRTFLSNALASGLGFGAIFAYIAGSSFVLENIYHLSPQIFGLCFAANAIGLVCAGQINARIVTRLGSNVLLTRGLISLASGGVLLLVVELSSKPPLLLVLGCLFIVMASNGFVGPNAIALSLNNFPDSAGSASALVGVMQFAIGAVVAPLVGIGGNHDARPMAIAICALGLSAISARLILRRQLATKASPLGANAAA